MASIACVAGVGEVASSIHINLTVLFFFLFSFFCSLFSYFLIFIVSSFILSSYHPIIFVYFILNFAYCICHIAYFILHIFKNAARINSMHSVRKMFHRTEGNIERTSEFLDGISVRRVGCAGIGWAGMRLAEIGWDGRQGSIRWMKNRKRRTSR
jgi:predicted CDP-diglyceride synthetase/phosphatidate cytidylyltransferase